MINILIFDDSPTVVSSIEFRLKSFNSKFQIFKAYSYPESVKIINEVNIDLALIDLMMPSQNGIDFIQYLQSDKKYRDMSKVVISISSPTILKDHQLDSEVDVFIPKDDIDYGMIEMLIQLGYIEQLFNEEIETKKLAFEDANGFVKHYSRTEFAKDLEQLTQAWESHDMSQVTEIVEKMEGNASVLGLEEVAETCHAIKSSIKLNKLHILSLVSLMNQIDSNELIN